MGEDVNSHRRIGKGLGKLGFSRGGSTETAGFQGVKRMRLGEDVTIVIKLKKGYTLSIYKIKITNCSDINKKSLK